MRLVGTEGWETLESGRGSGSVSDVFSAHGYVEGEHHQRSAFPKNIYHSITAAWTGNYADGGSSGNCQGYAFAVDEVSSERRSFHLKAMAG